MKSNLEKMSFKKLFEDCYFSISKSRKQTMKAKVLNLAGGAAFALMAGVMTAINSSPVYADDTKNYPGAMCIRLSNSGGNPVNVWAGGLSNDNDHALFVICPAIKDVMNQRIKSGKVRVWDANPSTGQDIECRLNSYRFETLGQVGSFSGLVKSTGGIFWEQTLTELVFSMPATDSTNSNSHYFYTCKIPPRYSTADGRRYVSYISSYSIVEHGQNE